MLFRRIFVSHHGIVYILHGIERNLSGFAEQGIGKIAHHIDGVLGVSVFQ